MRWLDMRWLDRCLQKVRCRRSGDQVATSNVTWRWWLFLKSGDQMAVSSQVTRWLFLKSGDQMAASKIRTGSLQ